MKHGISFLILLFAGTIMSFQAIKNPSTYAWFNDKGKSIDFNKVEKEMMEADIILFGELHNNPHAHWFEQKVAKALFATKGDKLVLGCEMFESDNQLVLNEYLSGLINAKKLKENARLWDNYATDYAPIVDFAKENKLAVIATNTPRRYASMIFSGGFDVLETLSPEAKSYLPKLPIAYDTTVNCYNALLHSPMMGHSNENLPKAQAFKDATMAHFILANWEAGMTFFHWNGSYHSDNHEGIVWYLKQANPNLKIYTITTVDQESLDKLEDSYLGKADAILVTDPSFPTSY